MGVVIGPDTLDVSLHNNGRSLDVGMEVRMVVVSEVLVVMVVMVVMLVMVVILVELVMVATVQEPSHWAK
jgi:hypothetical protein